MTLLAGSIHENLVFWVPRRETLQPSNEEVFDIAGEAQIRNVHGNPGHGLQHTINDDPNPHSKATMIGLMTGLAFFEEAGNKPIYVLLPHVHPTFIGLNIGVAGAVGDLAGIVYLLIARYNGKDYAKVFWIVGVTNIVAGLLAAWIRPVPKGQLKAL